MKVLLAGANGYIGTRLIPVLLEKGHDVICLVRDKRHFHGRNDFSKQIRLITGDLFKESEIEAFPEDIDAAYYLVHSMQQAQDFAALEVLSAYNFIRALDKTNCRQIIYLGGIANDDKPSEHHGSRGGVENVLKAGKAALTVLRAGIIIGPGSASFEIIRDLTEKLPVMAVPRWVNTRCQPIAIGDVLGYLESVMMKEITFNKTFDIGGPDILAFKDMMLIYAKVHKLKRHIFVVPYLSPKISSYWLYFVTSTSFTLAQSLVNSMKNETIMKDHAIDDVVPRKCLSYREFIGSLVH
jgi:uncharacterized protein YbjT (DUF2867 family)